MFLKEKSSLSLSLFGVVSLSIIPCAALNLYKDLTFFNMWSTASNH